MALFDLVGRRWVLRIIWELHRADHPLTFRELRSACSDMSASVLTARVGELRSAGLVDHGDGGYDLTDLGGDLVTSMQPLLRWADRWARTLPADEQT